MNIKNYSIFGYEKVSKVEFSKTFETIPIKHPLWGPKMNFTTWKSYYTEVLSKNMKLPRGETRTLATR